MSATVPPRNHAVREGLLCGIGIPEQTGEMFPKVVPVTDPVPLRISSARPEATERLKAETGLDEARLTALVHRFYARAQADPLLGPVFAARIGDWDHHLGRMVDFWSSVALMTGRYHGQPVQAHAALPIEPGHFDLWLVLFRETARETCPPAGAALIIERAERIAQSLQIAAAAARGGPPVLRPARR